MKLLSILLSGVLLCCIPFQIFGQKSGLSNAHLVKTYTFYKNADPSLNHLNYFGAMAGPMHLSAGSKMVLTETVSNKNGYNHFKYQQLHEGLPIYGSRYFLHEKDGKVVTATGHYSPQVEASAQPSINPSTAVALAKHDMKASAYKGEATAILCFIDPAFPTVSERLQLAYQVDLFATKPFDKRRYFVDASTGKVIAQFPLILHEGVPSTAKTRYYGIQNITTDSIAPQEFLLRDLTRGEGIFVYNSEGSDFTSTSSNWDLTNSNGDEIALDAHYCTQEYYEMMLADYNWQGQDGNGKAFKAYVHGGDFVNAYWDGEGSTYGDGDCNNGPLTTLEVIGHEFTHGMVDYTSKLIYDSESGAINESLADMFGKMLERKTDPANFSWDLGHSFLLDPDLEPFRVMDDPNSLEMPAFYKGQFWLDYNDVHINSSIGNLWFSMLVDGKQGINEAGQTFNVPALGMGKTGQIVFYANKNFLTENSDYNALCQYSIEAAEEIYGTGSAEAAAVTEAWKAVGLPTSNNQFFDLSFSEDGFFLNTVCGIDQFIPVSFKILNSSGTAYDPAMMATLTLSTGSLPNYTYHLTSVINPGEYLEVQVNDWLKATGAGFIYVNATLDLDDDNLDNNYSTAFFDVLEFTSNELSLFGDNIPQGCFSTKSQIFLFITNNSCEAIPSGTVLNFTATDAFGNVVWTPPSYTLSADLVSNSNEFVFLEIPFPNSIEAINLVFPNDPDPSNNQYYLGQVQALPITSNYFNSFDNNSGFDDYLELTFDNSDPTMLYLGSHHFASTGHFQNPDDFISCADPFKVFDYEFIEGVNASIHACVDFSFSPAPVLEFDLTQFRNTFTDTSNYQFSSMFQAKWTGAESGNQILYNQTEGLIKHHNISLPPFFKGDLDLKLYTELGHLGLDPFFLNVDDFVLLDNLKLSGPTSGTEDLATNTSILIAPNPAKEITSIQATSGIKTILLQNVSGQTLQTLQVNANRYDLDLKGLHNGFYLLNIQLENGQWAVKKLVKMD